MTKEELSKNEIIKQEIDCWKVHLELDKFNYNRTFSNLIAYVAIILSLVFAISTIFMSINEVVLAHRILGTAIYTVFSTIIILRIYDYYQLKIADHNKSFMARERMLRDRYEKLGVTRKKLDDEFDKIKSGL